MSRLSETLFLVLYLGPQTALRLSGVIKVKPLRGFSRQMRIIIFDLYDSFFNICKVDLRVLL